MKLYVIPVGSICNASCEYCITKFRKFKGEEFLPLSKLEEALEDINPETIEITGGGEPFLHKDINKIIYACSKSAKTQIYTNGSLLNRLNPNLNIKELCISRAHYLGSKNHRIMGVDYDSEIISSLKHPVKLSLLLLKSGINTSEELFRYFKWAENHNVAKVVVRQLFEHDYPSNIFDEFVSSEELFKELSVQTYKMVDENPVLRYNELEIEFEYRSCSCENNNPVLHSDGEVNLSWETQ